MLPHTPTCPKKRDRMIRLGMRKISCRVSDRKIAWRDRPTERKKFEATIWNPTIGKTRNTICKPLTATLTSSSSVVKRQITALGAK